MKGLIPNYSSSSVLYADIYLLDCITIDRRGIPLDIFSYFSMKTSVVMLVRTDYARSL